jgi:hypothetical protein
MGIDDKIVYVRQTINHELNSEHVPNIFKLDKYSFLDSNKSINGQINSISHFTLKKECEYDGYSPFIIGFCGKIYIGCYLFKLNDDNVETREITYDVDLMKSIFRNNFYKSIDKINNILNYDFNSIFHEINAPIFIRTYKNRYINNNDEFIINPILKDYEFYSVFDSFSAFQEIQMYISGVICSNENKTLKIEDKYKIEQHGFDKWSFRRESKK